MKYSSTTRLINVIIFALLAVGFGFLGIYFGILVAPFRWTGTPGPLGENIDLGWGLVALLGALGLAGLIVSLYGLVCSVRSVMKGNNDSLVRRSFSSYVGLGYIVALFFFFNATWLYRLTSTNIGYDDIGFVIVVYAIAFLVAIIVSNIPLLRMYGEGEELNKIMRVITGPLTAAGLAMLLVFGISFLTLSGAGDVYQKGAVSLELGVGALFFLAVTLLACLAFLGYGKADKNHTISKLNGLLFEGALALVGAAIITAASMEYVQQSGKNAPSISLVAKTVPTTNAYYMDFAVTGWIFGSLIVILACYLALSTLRGKEAKN